MGMCGVSVSHYWVGGVCVCVNDSGGIVCVLNERGGRHVRVSNYFKVEGCM